MGAGAGRSGASRYSNLRAHALGAIDEGALPPPIPGEEPLSPPIPFVAPQSPKITHLPLANAASLFDVRESTSEGGLFSGKEQLVARIGFAADEAPDEKGAIDPKNPKSPGKKPDGGFGDEYDQ